MFQFNLEDASGLFTAGLVYAGMVAAAFWLAMILWTFRDMRARSRDTLAQLLVAIMVAVLTVPGLLIYLLLRPRETLAEAYERSLEEEALLQEIEEKPVCPGCKQRIHEDWQACPNCHTRLKKPCIRCGKMLELQWDICPHCTTAQPAMAVERPLDRALEYAMPTRGAQVAEPPMSAPRSRPRPARRTSGEALEFVEGDDLS